MKLVIPGEPIPQQRPRLYKRRGVSGCYDPNGKQKDIIKLQIADQLKRYMPFKLLEMPRISFIWHMPIPKAVSKKMRPQFNSGLLKHISKPDVDNLSKLYMDCMTGLVYADDNCASLGFAIKLYHWDPKTIIFINETDPFLSPEQIDPIAYCALFGPESGTQSCEEISSLDDFYSPTRLIDLRFVGKRFLFPPAQS